MQAVLVDLPAGIGESFVEVGERSGVLLEDIRHFEAQGIQRHINPVCTRNDCMGRPLQMVIGVIAGLLLAGCADDWGVDQHGRKVAAEQLEGQWLVINYWAEWCKPCRTEIPELNRLAVALEGQGARVLGVNFDALQGEALSKAAEAFAIRFTVLAQDPAARLQLPRNDVLPVTYIIDADGRLRERLVGEQTAAGLQARLAHWQAQE